MYISYCHWSYFFSKAFMMDILYHSNDSELAVFCFDNTARCIPLDAQCPLCSLIDNVVPYLTIYIIFIKKAAFQQFYLKDIIKSRIGKNCVMPNFLIVYNPCTIHPRCSQRSTKKS